MKAESKAMEKVVVIVAIIAMVGSRKGRVVTIVA